MEVVKNCVKHILKRGRRAYKHIMKRGRRAYKHIMKRGRRAYKHIMKRGRRAYKQWACGRAVRKFTSNSAVSGSIPPCGTFG